MLKEQYYMLLQYALTGVEIETLLLKDTDWREVYNFFDRHAILPLSLDIIPLVSDEYSELKKAWKEAVYSNVYSFSRLLSRQEKILDVLKHNQIAVVVLKGTSAAQYYPKPQLRTMGDIDLFVNPENFEQALSCLITIGCVDTTSQSEIEKGRHRSFIYQGVPVELHRCFSLYVDEDRAFMLDTLLYSAMLHNITVLPDEENGLVLLSHIRQHLEEGLGLRQIIDWMMFVRTYLNDETWFSSFHEKTQRTGLESLAIITTKMCQKYLALSTDNITWCKEADEKVCDNLMQYIMDCGNFGRSLSVLQSPIIKELPSLSQPVQLFKYIQSHGEQNWKLLIKYPWLKPFA